MIAHFQSELGFLGIVSSAAVVRSAGGSDCIQRFFGTLEEQLLWFRRFRNSAELRLALIEWVRTYNEHWFIERHGHRAPSFVRRELPAIKASA